MLNSGSFSPLWGKQFQPKRKDRVIVRLDGVGVDSEGINFEKTKNTFLNILNKGSFYIYQSQFAKNCFSNIYHTNNKGRVILMVRLIIILKKNCKCTFKKDKSAVQKTFIL